MWLSRHALRRGRGVKVVKASFPTLKVRKEAFTDIAQPKAARSAGLPPATGSTSELRFSSTETPAPGFGRSV